MCYSFLTFEPKLHLIDEAQKYVFAKNGAINISELLLDMCAFSFLDYSFIRKKHTCKQCINYVKGRNCVHMYTQIRKNSRD